MKKFPSKFFEMNRERFMQILPDCLIVISAHCLLQESADLSFPFRQDSGFWYLSGIGEPDILLVLDTKSGDASILLPEQSEYQKIWEGERDTKALAKSSGIKNFSGRSALSEKVRSAIRNKQKIAYLAPLSERVEPYGFYANPARKILEGELLQIGAELVDVRMELARLRQVKQPIEIQAIKEAINITADSMASIKKQINSFSTEKEVERALTSEFYSRGSDGHAFEPVIASGKNAAVIHYHATNESVVSKNGLILLDVGAKVSGYAADISRTWAVGKVSDEQKAVYESVLKLQDKAFKLLKTGVDIKKFQIDIEKEAAKMTKNLGYKPRKFPHGISHFLGIDVHDAGDYSAPLTEGSVITVEPGLYFQEAGIGARLEDNILITSHGIENLSAKIPRTL